MFRNAINQLPSLIAFCFILIHYYIKVPLGSCEIRMQNCPTRRLFPDAGACNLK